MLTVNLTSKKMMPRTHELSPVTQSQIRRIQRDNFIDAMNRVAKLIEEFNITDDDPKCPCPYIPIASQPKNPQTKQISLKAKRKREKKKYHIFLVKIESNREYYLEELINIYNLTFDTDITPRGFSKLKETKKYFDVWKCSENGKSITKYKLK